MDRGVWAIYNTGNKLDDYRQMFPDYRFIG